MIMSTDVDDLVSHIPHRLLQAVFINTFHPHRDDLVLIFLRTISADPFNNAVLLTDHLKQIQKFSGLVFDLYHQADTLLAGGVNLVSGGTDNHLMLLDLRSIDMSGQELEDRLDRVHITVNKNSIPGDTRPPMETSGIRIGTPAVTTRGFKEEEMKIVGDLILKSIFDFDMSRGEILSTVDELCTKYPLY